MATSISPVTAALCRYASALHAEAEGRHHIASPLGAWLMVALAAGATRGAERRAIADVLGMDVDAAANVAADLLGNPHPAVGSAAGLWVTRDVHSAGLPDSERLRAWLGRVPEVVDTGAVPAQPALDAWARRGSLGMIEQFPVTVGNDTMALLATVLATKVSWREPFRVVAANELGGPDSLAGRNQFALRTPDTGHEQCIVATPDIGDVALHVGSTHTGLAVYSVAADPAVPQAKVLATAYTLACDHALGRPIANRSLFDLPLGRTALWEITETAEMVTSPDGRQERCTAVLPAWSARDEHNLNRDALGVPALALSLAKALGLSEYAVVAKQVAVAKYDRCGFEAAAVSAMAVLLGCAMPSPGTLRVADLRFANPYAVVAVVDARKGEGGKRWAGLPVFSAWVARSDEVEELADALAADSAIDLSASGSARSAAAPQDLAS